MVHERAIRIAIWHEWAKPQRIDVAKNEIAAILDMLLTKIAPEIRRLAHMTEKFAGVAGLQHAIESTAKAAQPVAPPINGFRIVVIRHSDGALIAEVAREDAQGVCSFFAKGRMRSCIVIANLKSLLPQFLHIRKILLIAACFTPGIRLSNGRAGPNSNRRAKSEIRQKIVHRAAAIEGLCVGIVKDCERKRAIIGPYSPICCEQVLA